MKPIKYILIIIIFFLFANHTFSQTDSLINDSDVFITVDTTSTFVNINEFDKQTDTTIIDSSYIKSPRRAAILSTFCPGLGQIYNEKYWKAPIVWTFMGASIYAVFYCFNNYFHYIDDYIIVISNTNPDPNYKPITWSGKTDLAEIKKKKLEWRKYRDYSVLGMLAIYTLNVVDANVDAHFSNFDVNEDLSLKISPTLIHLNTDNYYLGVNFYVKF